MTKQLFYSIGHTTRKLDNFIYLLKSQDISFLADIRSVPRSLKNPEYNQNILPLSLNKEGIGYRHITRLGGFRARSKTVPEAMNSYWTHTSFKNYADYALSEEFREGLNQLIDLGRKYKVAFMCAEQVWWKCHRRIVTDYLLAAGEKVIHIIDKNNIKEARLSPAAIINADGSLSYPLAEK